MRSPQTIAPGTLTARLLAFALGATLALPAMAEEVTVFAAASLKTALDTVAADWQAVTGTPVTISYAGSNALAKQIIEGAPADIYVSAAENWMDEVEKQGLTQPGTRMDLLGNTLVLVAATGATPVEIAPGFALKSLLGEDKLAMALVDSVPAGQYGKAALTALGIWEAVEPSVAQAENVRAALALVSSGEAPFGIVYATDAMADPGVTVVGTFPDTSHPPIRYPMALLTGAADPADRAFYDHLSSAAAAATFAAQGFDVLN